jgi:hypothetical protein
MLAPRTEREYRRYVPLWEADGQPGPALWVTGHASAHARTERPCDALAGRAAAWRPRGRTLLKVDEHRVGPFGVGMLIVKPSSAASSPVKSATCRT